MNKIRTIFFLMLLCAVQVYGALKTGSQLKQLPVNTGLDGSQIQLEKYLGKKFVVLYIWTLNQASLNEFYPLSNALPQLRNNAEFISIGIGEAEQLKRFPGVSKLGIPVVADSRQAAVKMFARSGDTLPLCVLLDKDGTLLWRGKLQLLGKVLKECAAGKFNLAAEIEVEEFRTAVNAAIKKGDFEKALQLVSSEYKKHPRQLNLLKAQIALLQKLKRQSEALTLLHKVQSEQPHNYRIFELEYTILGETEDQQKLNDFFGRVKKNFAGKPQILMAFALAECKLPPEKIDLAIILDLAETGWRSQAFSEKISRGEYALDYAGILHSLGRNDLASILAKEACEDLKEDKKRYSKALQALTYYTKIAKIAPGIKLPDLKK